MTWLSGRSRRPWLQEQDLDNLVNEDPRPAVPNELFTTILPGMGQEVDAPAEERTSNLRTSAVNRLLGVIQVDNQEDAKVVSSLVNRLVEYAAYQVAAQEGECAGIIDELERWQDVLWWGAAAAQKAAGQNTAARKAAAIAPPDASRHCRVHSAPPDQAQLLAALPTWEQQAAEPADECTPATEPSSHGASARDGSGPIARLPPIPRLSGMMPKPAESELSAVAADPDPATTAPPAAVAETSLPRQASHRWIPLLAQTATAAGAAVTAARRRSTAGVGSGAMQVPATQGPSPSIRRTPTASTGSRPSPRQSTGSGSTSQPAAMTRVPSARLSSPGSSRSSATAATAPRPRQLSSSSIGAAGAQATTPRSSSTGAGGRGSGAAALRGVASLWAYQQAMRRASVGSGAGAVTRLSSGREWGQGPGGTQGLSGAQSSGAASDAQVGFEGAVGRRLKEIAREQLETIMKHEKRSVGVGLSKRSVVAAISNMQIAGGGGGKEADSD